MIVSANREEAGHPSERIVTQQTLKLRRNRLIDASLGGVRCLLHPAYIPDEPVISFVLVRSTFVLLRGSLFIE